MSLTLKEIYRFEEFELNCARRALLRQGQPVPLSPKAFEVLAHLVMHPGEVVTKEELIQAVWPESFVEEGNLAHQVSSIRRAFADRASYIVTVPGRGYQFTAEVERHIPARANEVDPGEQVPAGQTLIGMQTVRESTHIVVEEAVTTPLPGGPSRAATLWGRRSVRLSLWAGAGILVAALVALFTWRLTHPPSYGHAVTVIADLDNETGDTDFDHSLNRVLQIDLQQSPYFTIVGEGRARRILKMMSQPVDEPITAPLSREICQRLNGQVYVAPAIAKVGGRYLLTLEANDCADGHSLGAAHKEVSSKGEILGAFSALIRQVRRAAGESRASLGSFDNPVYDEPTASLDALKAYSEATRFGVDGKFSESIALFRHAIELDPNFAVAYADMAGMYYNIGDRPHDREAIIKAYALRNTVGERERLYLEFRYHQSVTGNLHAQLDALRQWAATYPQDNIPLDDLVNLETWTGQYGAAAADADRALDIERHNNIHNGIAYEIAARAYHHANIPDKLRAVIAEAQQWKADTEGLHGIMVQFAAENGDAAGVEREISWSRGKPDESHILQEAASTALAAGEVRRADALFAEATSAARRDNLQDTLIDIEDYRVRMLAELGLIAEARALLKRLPPADPSLDKAFTEAMVGNATQALAEAQRQQTATPNDVLLNVEYAPSVSAAIALRQGKPNEAVALLQSVEPYELRDPTVPYLRGQAYLASHQGPQAAVEFEKLADHPWLADPPAPLIVLAHLGLARAYALENKTAESRSEYEKFFALWKDADKDIPALKQAHSEYAQTDKGH